jgi:cell division protein ZapB
MLRSCSKSVLMLTLLITLDAINVVSATILLMTQSEKDPQIELAALEAKLDALIVEFNQLKTENKSLKAKQDTLVKEKAKLLEKTTLAKARVEAMITRLKAMEHDS